jgi:hypothetical protein
VRHQAGPRLEPLLFDEIGVGPDGGKLKDLVEAFVQTRGFYIVEDECHRGLPVTCVGACTEAPSG